MRCKKNNSTLEVDYFSNFNLTNIITPIKADILEKILTQTNYDQKKQDYLISGFKQGFDIGYHGPEQRQDVSDNIPIKISSKLEMWNKVMKEVQANRYAGPFEDIPFNNYIQSPIGLVPKDGGKKTRLIFHLSYNFKSGGISLNHHTPKEMCKVKYRDLDHAVSNCLKMLEKFGVKGPIFYAKTDI